MNGELMQLAKDWIWIGWILSPLFAGIGLLWLKERFPTKQEHTAQTAELRKAVDGLAANVEKRHLDAELRLSRLESNTPSRHDMEEIYRRLGKVEQTTAVTNEAVAGLGRLLGKVDHTATLLLNRELNEAGK